MTLHEYVLRNCPHILGGKLGYFDDLGMEINARIATSDHTPFFLLMTPKAQKHFKEFNIEITPISESNSDIPADAPKLTHELKQKNFQLCKLKVPEAHYP